MIGKRVNVYFSDMSSLMDVLVEYEPCNVGDSWKLISKDGLEHRVIFFELMSEIKQLQKARGENVENIK